MFKFITQSLIGLSLFAAPFAHGQSNSLPDTSVVDALIDGNSIPEDMMNSLWLEHMFKTSLLMALNVQESLLIEGSHQSDPSAGVIVNLPLSLVSGMATFGLLNLVGKAHELNVHDKQDLLNLIVDYKKKINERSIVAFRYNRAKHMHFSTVDKEKKRLLQIDKEIAQHKLMVAKVTRLHRFLSKTRVLIVGGLSVLMLENTIGYGTQMFIPYNEMQALKEKLRQDIASYEQLFLEVGQISIPLEEQ